jgi:beta-1,4-mannosyl-glycoprotein beta-1,4-N-acetylglucosaminyltransferase
MKVFDAFIFNNELDLLEIRLNILDPYVDFFVINESPITFSGKEKPLYFLENKDRYSKFKDKIIHTVISDTPTSFIDTLQFISEEQSKDIEIRNSILRSMMTYNTWDKRELQWGREVYQRECLLRGLGACNSEDMVIISDVDEIPNPQALKACKQGFKEGLTYILEQKMFYYYLNCLKVDEVWLGSKVCNFGYAKESGLNKIRSNKESGIRIKEGGWHFSFLGGVEKIKLKLEAYSHQEYNNDEIKNNIEIRMSQNKDILGRPGEFKTIILDDTYPDFIRYNYDNYKELIR